MENRFVNTHTHFLESQHLSLFQAENSVVNQLFSYGIHPWEANIKVWNHDVFFHSNCVAIGECGLDKLRGPAIEIQEKVFRMQVELSEKHQKPLILHCVKTWEEIRKIKRDLKPLQTWIFHGLAKINLMQEVIDEGLIPSFGKALLFNSKLLEEVVKLELNQFLLETDDAVFHIEHIYKAIATAKNIPLQAVIKAQNENYKRIFEHGKMVGTHGTSAE